MSDSGEPKTSVQGEVTKNIKKRMFDSDEDEDPKSTSSKIQFERTEKENDALPLACSICKEPFLDPIVTKCNHYFCNNCALKQHEKNSKCYVCNQPTLGVFNKAVEIKKTIAKLRERAKAMVKEVKTMVEKAVVTVKGAEAMAAESAEMVEGVETLVGIMETFGTHSVADPKWHSVLELVEYVENNAAKARDKAEKAAQMVKDANATMETARVHMAKALLVMKNVKWNV